MGRGRGRVQRTTTLLSEWDATRVAFELVIAAGENPPPEADSNEEEEKAVEEEGLLVFTTVGIEDGDDDDRRYYRFGTVGTYVFIILPTYE